MTGATSLGRSSHRLAIVFALAASVALGSVGAADPPAANGLSRWTGGIDLYRSGSFTTQKSWLWCTAAGVQIARNMVKGTRDHTVAGQRRYFNWMRGQNRYSLPVSAGVDPQGWAAGMRRFVDSRYRLVVGTSFSSTLRLAVKRMRLTNLPVGVTVSHGNHAWLLVGFTATRDPAVDPGFKVTERARRRAVVRPAEPLVRLRHGAEPKAHGRPVPALLHALVVRPEAHGLGPQVHLDPAGPDPEGEGGGAQARADGPDRHAGPRGDPGRCAPGDPLGDGPRDRRRRQRRGASGSGSPLSATT